jgi:hypothetical protein
MLFQPFQETTSLPLRKAQACFYQKERTSDLLRLL